ncbi:putative reverse transcriptase domain-containing protein [Tanacetum coccineum]
MMPPRMMTRSADRGGATPRDRRTDARKGRGGSRGNADNGIIGYNGNNDGIGNIELTTKETSMTGVERITQIGKTMRKDTNMATLEMETTTTMETDAHIRILWPTLEMAAAITMETDACIRNLWHVNQRSLMAKAKGRTIAVGMAWDDFKTLLRDKYCPQNEMQKLENEFWNHTMVGASHTTYTDRFHELAKIVPHLVTSESKRIDRYIYGLVTQIRGMVRATEPTTIQSAILKAGGLTDDAVRNGLLKRSSEKRKESGETARKEDARSKIRGLRLEKDSWRQILAIKSTRVFTLSLLNVATIIRRLHLAAHALTAISQVIASGQVQSNPNQVLAIGGNNFNRGNNGNQGGGRAFALGANEALQDPNIVTGSFDVISMVNGWKETEAPRKYEGRRKELKDSPIIRDFPKVFPDDLTGLPLIRTVEFRIDLVPEATHVAKAPYHLTPSDMQELSDQPQELKDKRFIRRIHSP